jgi:hypothetical protein
MDLSNLIRLKVPDTAIISAEAAVMVQETERLPVRDTKVRRLVPELRDRDLKAVRCRLYRRLPKRGFQMQKFEDIVGINVSELNRFEDGSEVTVRITDRGGVVSNPRDGVKILGNGELTKKLTRKSECVQRRRKEKIEAQVEQ